MPWDIRHVGSKFEVVDNKGKVYGRHSSRASARRQQAALYASEPQASKVDGAYQFSNEPPAGRDSAYNIAHIAYGNQPGIVNVDAMNGLKQMVTEKVNQDPSSSGQMPNDPGADLSGTVENTDTINWRRQYLNGSNSNRRRKKDDKEIPVKHTWQGQFFPRAD